MANSVRSLPTVSKAQAPAQKRLGLAAHVLRTLADAQVEGRRMDLDTLADELGVETDDASTQEGVRVKKLRREDVRAAVSQLDSEGFVDASRMRLTLAGFAMGNALSSRQAKLMPLHLVVG